MLNSNYTQQGLIRSFHDRSLQALAKVDNKLPIPTLEVNLEDSVFEVYNVGLGLSELARVRFSLESYDQ